VEDPAVAAEERYLEGRRMERGEANDSGGSSSAWGGRGKEGEVN